MESKATNSSGQDEMVKLMINKIIHKTDKAGDPLLNKFGPDWLVEKLNGKMLSDIEQKFKEYEAKGVDVIDFVKILLSSFAHQQSETIYLVVSLVELYKNITESFNITENVRFKDFTNFIVEVFPLYF